MRMKKFDEDYSNITLARLFNLSPELYDDVNIVNLPLSVRVTNRLYNNSILTIGSLLRTNSASLMNIKGFGKNCLDQVYTYLENIKRQDNISEEIQETQILPQISIAKKYRDFIVLGDFSFISYCECSPDEKNVLLKYKEAYEILGKELVEKCLYDYIHISPIVYAFQNYCEKTKRYNKLKCLIENIPTKRRKNCCKYYIMAYSDEEVMRNAIENIYSSSDAALCSIIDSVNLDDNVECIIAGKFLEWCSYNACNLISELFENLYSNKRQKMLIEARANGQTLSEIGDTIHVTRERVRQIEAKAKRRFVKNLTHLRIISKIFADTNGRNIITLENIVEVSGNNASAFYYLLRTSECSYYTYDAQLDAFVLGDSNISLRIQNFVDSLPEMIRKKDIQDIIILAKEQEDISQDFIEKAIEESYKNTGEIYYKTRLSLAKIYDDILRTHYPEGIHVSDDKEIDKFRDYIIKEYGDISLPENNRAISTRISSIGVLAGRGIYIAKRNQWISKALEYKILDYIEKSDSPIILIGTVFYEFEEDLLKEGIDNRYFLQGVLREISGEKYYFRRDYISKRKDFTSMYSSIVAYIKENKYPVSRDEIQARFHGITDIMISMAISDSEILNYFGEYLHGSCLDISEVEENSLYNSILKILSDNDVHHIKDVYVVLLKENSHVLYRNGVNNSYRAFSVLEYLFKDRFQFSRPYLAQYGTEIGKPFERLHDLIFESEEYAVSDISDFARDNHMQISSMIDYLNSLNDKFMIYDRNNIVSFKSLAITPDLTYEIEKIIEKNINETCPIRNLSCIGQFPRISRDWSEWLIYSCLYKWGKRLDVALSSGQFRQSIPLVSLKGLMNTDGFKGVSSAPVNIKIDNMDNIDDLVAEIITEDMLEDI